MVTRGNATRRKTRHLMAKHFRKKGKISMTRYFAEYEQGTKVQLVAEPAVNKGMYNTRFYGRAGTIKKKVGSCYHVEIKDGNKTKLILSHPIHLKPLHSKK